MNYNNNNEYTRTDLSHLENQNTKQEWKCPLSLLLVFLCVAIVLTMLFTFNLTSRWIRAQDFVIIQQQQQTIDNLKEASENDDFGKLKVLAELLEQYSYYSNKFNTEQMLDEVMRAYTYATGDKYAAYYTEEEYAAISSDNAGAGVGIGVSIVQESLTVGQQEYLTFHIVQIFKNAPAEISGLLLKDRIYAIEVDGEIKTVEELGGYNAAINAIRGEIGSTVKLLAFRADENGVYESHEFSVVRNTYTKEAVTYRVSETDAGVGIVHISEFNLQTPVQFKQAISALQKQNVKRFIFDVRNNPGGDLQSIKAVLSYLLKDGDLILTAIDNQGNNVSPVYAEAVMHTGAYASCSVLKEEVGMFADLDIVILCNGNTASAAEVFTASLRDHKNVPIIGETTFGKGIMQRYYSLAMLTGGVYDGYVKMTTHVFVTACGVTYHDVGIVPTVGYEVALSDEAKEYHFYLLPENVDNQLQKAIEAVKK